MTNCTFYVDFRGEDHFGTLVTLLDEQGKEHAIEHIWMTDHQLWLRPVNCPMGLNWVKTTNSQGLIDIYPIVIEP